MSFCWSGDTAGQGWGIDEARGGMTIYSAILKNRPDFFIHSGDTIYADGPIQSEVKLPDGSLWRNRVTEEVAKPAETLAEFRGRHKYNLTDRNVLAMNAAVPILAQWDDHEVTNNWWPGEPLTRAEHLKKKYADPNVLALQLRAAKAFHEYMPMRFEPSEPGRVYRKIGYGPLVDVFMLDMRSYRGPNGENRQTAYGPESHFLGPQQIAWLKRALLESRATWKVIAADMPLGLVVTYDTDRNFGSEAVAQGDGPPLGRELEIADLLRFIKSAGIRNTSPGSRPTCTTRPPTTTTPTRRSSRISSRSGSSSPGRCTRATFGPNALDNTFGPQLRYVKAPDKGQVNLSPAAGYQFFGHVAVDGRTEQMTVTLKDAADTDLWHVTLDPVKA